MVKVKDRNSNFELMRIISMLFIVLWHIIMHGNMLNNSLNESISVILEVIQYIIIVHVNSFVLLSGYFQSKSRFKLSKFLDLLLQVIFYSILILGLGIKLGIIKDYSAVSFINNLLPSSVNNYWFIKVYIVVYLLSDIINKFINSLDRKSYKNTLIILFIIFSISSFVTGGKFFENSGYNFYNFIFLYMIGGYLRRYPIKETYHLKNFSTNGYRCLLIFCFFLMAYLNYSLVQIADNINGYNGLFIELYNRISYSHLAYSTPFVMIQTICYFLLFETVNIKSRFINLISSCTFGIYLLHDNNFVRGVIYKFFKIDNGYFNSYHMLAHMFSVLILIFVIGLIVELIRKLIIWLLLKCKLTQKFIDKIKAFVNSFNFEINW